MALSLRQEIARKVLAPRRPPSLESGIRIHHAYTQTKRIPAQASIAILTPTSTSTSSLPSLPSPQSWHRGRERPASKRAVVDSPIRAALRARLGRRRRRRAAESRPVVCFGYATAVAIPGCRPRLGSHGRLQPKATVGRRKGMGTAVLVSGRRTWRRRGSPATSPVAEVLVEFADTRICDDARAVDVRRGQDSERANANAIRRLANAGSNARGSVLFAAVVLAACA
uniref:Uncharacterized protein n=1 Tax=Mycena chlorophos TaxID=658473 RepID=A0ABQ0LNW0_MYCCL|nr:predicted protein [Mycena chlorophos]